MERILRAAGAPIAEVFGEELENLDDFDSPVESGVAS